MGVFNLFGISDFRNPVDSFWIYARIEFEQEGEYPVGFEFRTIEGEPIFQVNASISLEQKPSSQLKPVGELKFRVNGFRFPRQGVYELAVKVNNKVEQTVPVEVIVPKAPYRQ